MIILIEIIRFIVKIERKFLKTNFFSSIYEKLIFSYIKNSVSMPITKKVIDLDGNIIWTAWFQGAEHAPDLVLSCISSFRKINDARVIVIDDRNFEDYLIIPDAIVSKYREGLISKTAFSEIVRIELLATYGGLWIDSTVFIPKEISYPVLNDFFTLKSVANLKNGELFGLVPAYMLGCKKGYIPILKIRNLLLSYWMSRNRQVDYFLVDYIFKYIFSNDQYFYNDVINLDVIGENRYYLLSVMNECFNEILAKEIKNKCMAYKLTNKVIFRDLNDDKPTIYSKVINGEI